VMVKSIREAKLRSTWAAPNQPYEDAVRSFIDGALNPDQSAAFLRAFLPLQERIATLGMQNSLAQLALKLTSPGVPDIYQGADLWDFNLVDPDNRRPVDYSIRTRLLGEILADLCRDRHQTICRLISNWKDGGIKLAVTATLLAFRREHEELFTEGTYEPVLAEGPAAERLCAFVRRHAETALLVAVSRFPAQNASGWANTTLKLPEDLANRHWRDVLTGAALDQPSPESLFADLPAAVATLRG